MSGPEGTSGRLRAFTEPIERIFTTNEKTESSKLSDSSSKTERARSKTLSSLSQNISTIKANLKSHIKTAAAHYPQWQKEIVQMITEKAKYKAIQSKTVVKLASHRDLRTKGEDVSLATCISLKKSKDHLTKKLEIIEKEINELHDVKESDYLTNINNIYEALNKIEEGAWGARALHNNQGLKVRFTKLKGDLTHIATSKSVGDTIEHMQNRILALQIIGEVIDSVTTRITEMKESYKPNIQSDVSIEMSKLINLQKFYKNVTSAAKNKNADNAGEDERKEITDLIMDLKKMEKEIEEIKSKLPSEELIKNREIPVVMIFNEAMNLINDSHIHLEKKIKIIDFLSKLKDERKADLSVINEITFNTFYKVLTDFRTANKLPMDISNKIDNIFYL